MSKVEIIPVETGADRRRFATFPWQVYQGDPLWVPPLLGERLKFIDPQTGVFFKRGIAEFFMLLKNGRLAGTICCADDRETNQARGLKDCMIGFFECLEDEEMAVELFEHACTWARSHGLDHLYGPFNLDYEDG